MQSFRLTAGLVAGTLAAVPGSLAAAEMGQGSAVVTLISKNEGSLRDLEPQNLQVRVDGKQSSVTSIIAAKGPDSPLELVVLIDSSARASLGTQLGEISGFIKEMPTNTRMAIAYMENGRAVLSGPLSYDPAPILNSLHLPNGGPGQSSSPYFCLSDLAKNWPSRDTAARREVVMITDGIDSFQPRLDLNDPYVQSSIDDAVRAGLVVYSFYWRSQGRLDRSPSETNAGQSLLSEVTQATGGNSYGEGLGNPVSFSPYFKDLRQRFQNQYRVGFSSDFKGKPHLERFSVKLSGSEARVTAPQQVLVRWGGASARE